jgi:hypothetical protein
VWLVHRHRVDGIAAEQHPVRPKALRESFIALPQSHEQRIVGDGHARETCVSNALGAERKRGVQDSQHEGIGVARGGGVIRLDGNGRSLKDSPVDGEVALDKGLLQQSREAEALRIARIGAAGEHGEPLVLGGSCLGEKVPKERLGRAADLLCGFGKTKY